MLQSMRLQRVRNDLETEQQQQNLSSLFYCSVELEPVQAIFKSMINIVEVANVHPLFFCYVN